MTLTEIKEMNQKVAHAMGFEGTWNAWNFCEDMNFAYQLLDKFAESENVAIQKDKGKWGVITYEQFLRIVKACYANIPDDAYVTWVTEDKDYGVFNIIINSSSFEEIGKNDHIPKASIDDYKVLFPDN